MSGRSFNRDNIPDFKPQVVDIPVKALPGVLEPYFNYFIFCGTFRQVAEPVEGVKFIASGLVCGIGQEEFIPCLIL